MKQLYLVRHCKAFGQEPEAQLTEEGRIQAVQIQAFFRDRSIDYIVSSPFKRAMDTIAPFANDRGMPIHIEDRLRERVLSSENLVDWMPLLRESFEDLDKKLSGGESSREAMTRGISVIQQLLERNEQNMIVVTHGNLLSLIIKHYEDRFGYEEWMALTNPDIYRLTVHEREISLERVWP